MIERKKTATDVSLCKEKKFWVNQSVYSQQNCG